MLLADKKCEACHGGMPTLKSTEIAALLDQLQGWELNAASHLQKSIQTPDFKQALELANMVGDLAEEQDHHPILVVRWGELRIELWTHAVNGLCEIDFVMAAKIDRALSKV